LFRRSDHRDGGPDERALAARNAVTQGFLALDDEQRAAATAVGAAEQLGGGSAGRLAAAWAEVATVGDAATEAYLTASREFPLDGTGPVRGAKEADEHALRQIDRARETIRRFRATHARTLGEAEFALTTLPGAVQEARSALVSARAAVTGAEVASRRAAERLAEAEAAAARLDVTGLRERRQAAQQVLELARSAATLAAEAPQTARQVRSALSSIATRSAAAATKAERIEPAMSALRREFSEPCSRDLVGAEAQTREAISAADAAIAAARRHADAGDWDDAADAVAAARSALGRAEERHDAVTDRLAELRDVRTDPAKHAADTRFVLRDAQRLVVDRGLVAQLGPTLDAQSVRLDNARARLDEGVHPDYWFYLTELRGIRDRVRDVVERVRTASQRT
jgi:hypothetical protein